MSSSHANSALSSLLARGTPKNENDLWNASAQVLNGTLTPEEAGASVQRGLESWYAPQQ